MYRMFIKEQKKKLIDRIGERGGGYVPAEILVCHDFESAVPDPEERKHWNEIVWKVDNQNLLEACKAQHEAIDILFAKLIQLDPTFFPSKSGQPWEAIVKGKKAIDKAEGR